MILSGCNCDWSGNLGQIGMDPGMGVAQDDATPTDDATTEKYKKTTAYYDPFGFGTGASKASTISVAQDLGFEEMGAPLQFTFATPPQVKAVGTELTKTQAGLPDLPQDDAGTGTDAELEARKKLTHIQGQTAQPFGPVKWSSTLKGWFWPGPPTAQAHLLPDVTVPATPTSPATKGITMIAWSGVKTPGEQWPALKKTVVTEKTSTPTNEGAVTLIPKDKKKDEKKDDNGALSDIGTMTPEQKIQYAHEQAWIGYRQAPKSTLDVITAADIYNRPLSTSKSLKLLKAGDTVDAYKLIVPAAAGEPNADYKKYIPTVLPEGFLVTHAVSKPKATTEMKAASITWSPDLITKVAGLATEAFHKLVLFVMVNIQGKSEKEAKQILAKTPAQKYVLDALKKAAKDAKVLDDGRLESTGQDAKVVAAAQAATSGAGIALALGAGALLLFLVTRGRRR